jgi:hypothetical protein
MDLVCYIPSHNNSEHVGDSVRSAQGLPCIIVDNHSTDEHLSHLERLAANSGNVSLLRHDMNLGRIANWEFCVRHFLRSGRTWLKWLFAGDLLTSGVSQRIDALVERFPDARLIAGAFMLVDGRRRQLYRPLPATRLILPAESMRLTAMYGNWFGPPSALCVHRDAVAEHFEFGTLPWSADLAFCVDVSARFPVAYIAEPLAEFHVSCRQFYSRHSGGQSTLLQEGLVRHGAIERFQTLTTNADQTARLLRNTEATLAGHIFLAAIRRVGLYCLLANTARLAIRVFGRRFSRRTRFLAEKRTSPQQARTTQIHP